MIRSRRSRRTVTRGVAVLWMVFLAGCRGGHSRDGADPAAAADAGAEGGQAMATAPAAPVDSGAPPDETIPQTTGDELAGRAKHLLEAIAQDDPRLATDIVFPRDGWLATRDAADPGKEWDKRVAAPFRRSIHALSRRHKDFERAQFVSIELGHSMSQERTRPHSWKKALWTVYESRITFMVDGRTRTLPIRELTGWRGAWYVTRLR
jgi:hypothetical protein